MVGAAAVARLDHATPAGSWAVQAKQTDRDLIGPGYRNHVHIGMPFDADIGFHDAPWQSLPFGAVDYSNAGSHRCVHLPLPAMARLYRWAHIGAGVTVQDR